MRTLPVVIRPDSDNEGPLKRGGSPSTRTGISAQMLCAEWRPMAEIETRFAVFCGKVDQKRESGWYWTVAPRPGEPSKGPYNGPFETKADAVEHAVKSGGKLH